MKSPAAITMVDNQYELLRSETCAGCSGPGFQQVRVPMEIESGSFTVSVLGVPVQRCASCGQEVVSRVARKNLGRLLANEMAREEEAGTRAAVYEEEYGAMKGAESVSPGEREYYTKGGCHLLALAFLKISSSRFQLHGVFEQDSEGKTKAPSHILVYDYEKERYADVTGYYESVSEVCEEWGEYPFATRVKPMREGEIDFLIEEGAYHTPSSEDAREAAEVALRLLKG